MKFIYNDGGRSLAGYQGNTGDCVTRAIAIVTGKPYQEVYEAINSLALNERQTRTKGISNARTGVYKATTKKYIASLGLIWKPTMQIGSGCKVHLREDELPTGRLIVKVSRHMVAVIDGVIHDTFDPQRLAVECDDVDKEDVNGSRCVYGYWI